MKIFTVELSGGYGDNHYWNLIYAGNDYATAKTLATTAPFQDDYNNWAVIKTWENGITTAAEEVNR